MTACMYALGSDFSEGKMRWQRSLVAVNLPAHSDWIDSDNGNFLLFPIWTFEHSPLMHHKACRSDDNFSGLGT